MIKPIISVIMPVYNGGNFLSDAISSILEQSFTEFEFIIINDGSLDDSQKIVEHFAKADSRIRFINRENRGLVASLNEAIELSEGEFIARMDADDIALPQRLEKQLSFLKSKPDIDILGGQARIIDEKNHEVGVLRKPVSTNLLLSYSKFGCPIVHPTYMVRASAYRRLGGYRNLIAVEDFDFLLRAIDVGLKLSNISDEILLYRINSIGMSARNARRQIRGTRLILALQRARASGHGESRKILKELASTDVDRSTGWFDFWWKIRNHVLCLRKKNQKTLFYNLVVFFISLMHFELTMASYRAWRAIR